MVMSVALLMCKEVLWSAATVSYTKGRKMPWEYIKWNKCIVQTDVPTYTYMICYSQTAPLRELWYTTGVYSPLTGPT